MIIHKGTRISLLVSRPGSGQEIIQPTNRNECQLKNLTLDDKTNPYFRPTRGRQAITGKCLMTCPRCPGEPENRPTNQPKIKKVK